VVEEPLYPKVVAGFEETEPGEDARALAERVVAVDGGELKVVHVEKGSPANVLRELAEKGEADLIVLGSTHRAAFGSVAPGSVAEQLLKGTPARLVIAPRGFARARAARDAEEAGEMADDIPSDSPLPFIRDRLRVVAVGFDGTAESRAALDEAAILAGRVGAAIRVIGVSEPGPAVAGRAGSTPTPVAVGFDLPAMVHDVAAGLSSELRALPIHDQGDPVDKLLERAGEGVDLLMLGSRGFGPVMRAMLGSVSARVIRAAPCAVMIVPRSNLRASGRAP
jgi:nucleotide-binding universal stress UspA family protein